MGEWFYEEYGVLKLKENTKFYRQYQVAEEFNYTLPEEIKYPTYQSPSGIVWSSKPINTQQITQLLKNYQASKNIELDINDFNLDELNFQEDPQEQSSTQAQIELPPK